jgi:hypothetical protein
VGLLQTSGGNGGSIAQNLAVPTGSYQVNFQAVQRSNNGPSDQVVQVFLNNGTNDVFIGSIQPPSNSVYSPFTSATFSVTAPALTASITSTATNPTSTSPIPVTVTFSQSVTGFTAGDVTVGNGTVSGFSGSGTTYTFNVTPSGTGLVTVDVPANGAIDANNTDNTAAPQFTIQYNQPVTAAPVAITPANGSLTSDNTPIYSGTAPAGSTVTVVVDGSSVGTVSADASGNWSLTPVAALADGSHTLKATAQLSGQAVSPDSNTNTFTVDTTAPAAPVAITPANGSLTNDNTPTYSGTAEANSTVTVIVDGSAIGTTTANGSGNWSLTQPTALADGSHTIRATATDAVGNTSPSSNTNTFTVDTTVPTVAISSTASNPTSTSPIPVTVTFSESVTGFVAGDVTVGNGTVSGFSGSGTTYTFNVTPGGNGTVTVDVAASVAQDAAGNGNTAATQFSTVFTTATTWTGAVSTDWFTAGNWNNGVPTSTLDAVIPAGAPRYPTVSAGTASMRAFTLVAGGSLTQTAGTLDVKGTWTNNGTFSAPGGTVALTSAGGQMVGGSSLTRFWNLRVDAAGATLSSAATVQRLLTLNGSLNATGQTFTLESTTALTAMVVNNGGVVTGTTTVQRAIDPSVNAGAGYRHYSSPVANTTVGDLTTAGFTPVVNPAYNTSATPLLVTPFPTVFGYDQSRVATAVNNLDPFSKGWVSPLSLGDALTVGRGYTVNIAASQKVDFVGTLNNGNVLMSLARNSGASAFFSGWHLVGNPYPAPLDYSLVAPADRQNLDGAMFVFESSNQYGGTYRAYVNGVGGNPLVSSGQGFFVRVSNGNTSGTLNFRNSQRQTAFTNVPFRRGMADTRPLVQLSLQGASLTDEAYVYFEQGATAGLDTEFDAVKLPNTTGLNLAAQTSSEELAIQGLPVLGAGDVTVPMVVRVPATGSYTLHAAQLLNLPLGTHAYLRDRQTGALVDLGQQPSYSFTMNAAYTGVRFELLFTPQRVLSVAPASLSAQVAVYPNPASKSVFVELPATLGHKAVTVALVDALGRTVREQVLPAAGATAHRLSLVNVATGVYSLRLATEQGTVMKKLIVE